MPRFHGYTLIEMLVTIAIVGVILFFTQANLNDWLKMQQAKRVTQELIHLIHTSRNFAITSRRAFTLCGSSNGLSCDNQWHNGALLFEDANRNGLVEGADRITRYAPFNAKAVLQWQGFGNGQRLTFENMGISSASNGSFTYCDLSKEAKYSRQVIVSRGGRARLSLDKNNDGIYENVNGNPIACP